MKYFLQALISLVLPLMRVRVYDMCVCDFASCNSGLSVYMYRLLWVCVHKWMEYLYKRLTPDILTWAMGIMFTNNNTDYFKIPGFRHWLHDFKNFLVSCKSTFILKRKKIYKYHFSYLLLFVWGREAHICMPQCMCSGHRVIYRSLFSPSTIWALGIEFWSRTLV